MPVAFATLAIDRSISAHRMTKVRPTAMMPVTDTWVRMLPRLSSVVKEGLAKPKKATRQMSVRKGAMLRIWPRRHRPDARVAGLDLSRRCSDAFMPFGPRLTPPRAGDPC